MKFGNLVRAAAAALAVAAIAMVISADSGVASSGKGMISGSAITIKGKASKTGDTLRFVAPETVVTGQPLTIVNKTDPKKVGPHTFSLVNKSELPKTGKQIKHCFGSPKAICTRIAIAHEFDPKNNKVKKPIVDVGGIGWNTMFGSTGDTWYTHKPDETYSNVVTAPPGTTLTFMCAIHPWMQGKVKVVAAPLSSH